MRRALAARLWLALLLGLSLLLCACSKGTPAEQQSTASPKVFRVVRSKQLTGLAVLEKRRTLETALASRGVRVFLTKAQYAALVPPVSAPEN